MIIINKFKILILLIKLISILSDNFSELCYRLFYSGDIFNERTYGVNNSSNLFINGGYFR